MFFLQTNGSGVLSFAGVSSPIKSWVNFNGEGTPAIRASLNVSSITDNGTGDYTVNFTTSFADVNYAVTAFAGVESGTTDNNVVNVGQKGTVSSNYTVSSCRLQMMRMDLSVNDCRVVNAIFVR